MSEKKRRVKVTIRRKKGAPKLIPKLGKESENNFRVYLWPGHLKE
jgi:hypothetical protein